MLTDITLSQNYHIIVLPYKKDQAAYLYENDLIKAAKIFPILSSREDVYNWGIKYLEPKSN